MSPCPTCGKDVPRGPKFLPQTYCSKECYRKSDWRRKFSTVTRNPYHLRITLPGGNIEE